MRNSALEFYSDPNFTQSIISAKEGALSVHELHVPNTGILIGDSIPESVKPYLASNIETLYDSIKQYTTVVDGNEYTFELGFLAGTGNEVELRSATYQSSLSGNLGNGFEIAAAGVADPTKSVLYVASMGMGLSSLLPVAERKYLRKYGRLLFEDNGEITPLPVVKALAAIISHLGLTITSVGSDSAGILMTMAYGAAYGNGAITSAHQNVPTGLTDKTVPELFKGMVIDDGKLSAEHAKVSPDALRMNQDKLDFVSANLSEKYKGKNFKPKKSVAMLGTYAVGLGRGPIQGDPLIADSVAFTNTNPGANMLFTIGEQDSLADCADLKTRARMIVLATSRKSDATASAAIIEGANHGIQTHYPQFLRRLAATALK